MKRGMKQEQDNFQNTPDISVNR